MTLSTKELILMGAIGIVLEEEFDIDIEELLTNEFGLTEETQKELVKIFEENEVFSNLDDDGFIREELIGILKEIVDKVKQV